MKKTHPELASMAVGTSDSRDDAVPVELVDMLRVLRQQLSMDVVFVSKFADGLRTFVATDAADGQDVVRPGMSDPIEQSWCHHVVQGRLPELIRDGGPLIASGQAPFTPLAIGTHLSVPVVLPDGRVYGTVCTFAFHVDPRVSESDVQRLRNVARLIAARVSR